ncbi:Y-family DNA polymerase [Ferrovibrio xuzhouensis]|uniref:DNA-directed DNA polymerase n=1 Tax=Ferrovibrio xuzhouensis TaxID=1576914 RepID=A0ABV7VLP4_9PROT
MRRFLSVWLPRWPTDRLKKRLSNQPLGPLALIQTTANTARLFAVNTMAARMCLAPDMTLADAMALVPALGTAPADPQGDLAALERLADWCGRYSPWVATDGADGLILDITGVPHLFGGEDAMLDKVRQGFRQMQVIARCAMADSPAAAWAWAHHDGGGVLPSRPDCLEPLKQLPVAALRIDTRLADSLNTLGLKTVGAIANLPRAPLVKRFGPQLLDRLDCLLIRREEPISPRQQPAPWRSRAHLAEPISTREAIEQMLDQLLETLCPLLEQEHLGARQLALHAYRVDGDVQTIRIGTSAPSRNPKHLARLFRNPLDGIMPGFGFETFVLEAAAADPFSAEQANLEGTHQSGSGFAQLVDRLQARLGDRAVFRYEPVQRRTPEASVVRLTPTARSREEMPDLEPRPQRLMAQPESIEMDSTGEAFTWRRIRRRIALLDGPERIRGEWAPDGMDVVSRDYFRIEDEVGRRYWVYRSQEGWFMQGMFS